MYDFHLNSFDAKQYLSNNPDLVDSGITTPSKAWKHWVNYGINEGRTCNKRISNFEKKDSGIILFTNARDELRIKEWCLHHLNIGFDNIYIFDHLSIEPLEDVLYNFDKRVTTIRVKKKNEIKYNCIDYAIFLSKQLNAKWMLYLDCDEFLVLNEHNNVSDFINSYENADMISLNWLFFGTNGYITEPEGSIISNYTKSDLILNNHVKTFVKPDKIQSVNTPHSYHLIPGSMAYDSKRNKINSPGPFININCEYYNVIAYIAHYYYQSEETYFKRKNLKTDIGCIRSIETNIHEIGNSHFNDSIKIKYSLP